eukprot:gene5600-biopygen7509
MPRASAYRFVDDRSCSNPVLKWSPIKSVTVPIKFTIVAAHQSTFTYSKVEQPISIPTSYSMNGRCSGDRHNRSGAAATEPTAAHADPAADDGAACGSAFGADADSIL